MKNKLARALAIVALVFMVIFVAALIATLVDYTLLNNGIGFIALASGVFVLMIFIALKADGRGYSITKMNNEIEMRKIEKQIAEQEAHKATSPDTDGEKPADEPATDAAAVEPEPKADNAEAESDKQ